MTLCAGCDSILPPSKNLGRPRKWCSDRCRKETLYSSECVDCGAMCNTDGRVTDPALRCEPCSRKHEHERARNYYIDSVRDWVARYGSPPAAVDWKPFPSQLAKLHPERVEFILQAHRDRAWPHPYAAKRIFGSWRATIEAAGCEPLAIGQRRDVAAWHRHRWEAAA